MELKEIRKKRGFSRRELAERSGVNLRSIQDYEQGHKKISSAKSETIYRLSLALGCSTDDLIEIENVSEEKTKTKSEKRLRKYYESLQNMKNSIEGQTIYSEKYRIYGKWIIRGNACFLRFMYEGKMICLPFRAVFNEQTMPWLLDAAIVELEDMIEYIESDKKYEVEGGEVWNEQ